MAVSSQMARLWPEHDEWVHEAELADGAEVILRQYKDSHGLH